MADAPTTEELNSPVSVQNLKDVQEANDANYMPSGYQTARAEMGLGNTLGVLGVPYGGTGVGSTEELARVLAEAYAKQKAVTVPISFSIHPSSYGSFTVTDYEEFPYWVESTNQGFNITEAGIYAFSCDLTITATVAMSGGYASVAAPKFGGASLGSLDLMTGNSISVSKTGNESSGAKSMGNSLGSLLTNPVPLGGGTSVKFSSSESGSSDSNYRMTFSGTMTIRKIA
ncbi:MAG: hypothetical protein IJW29_06175 [Clostridia bacterium]|nr:hypothetical protein [Clostridia bacterium]